MKISERPFEVDFEADFQERFANDDLTRNNMATLLAEFLNNAKDAMSTLLKKAGFVPRIQLRIDRKNRRFFIIDNGIGLTELNQKGLTLVFKSVKRGDKTQIGKFGSGRLQALKYGPCFQYASKPLELPGGIHVSFTREDIRRAWNKEPIKAQFFSGLPSWCPPWPKDMPHGTIVEIVFTDENWRRMPPDDWFMEQLPFFVLPSIARIVTVNDKPLKKRTVVEGRFIEGTKDVPELGGEVLWELFLPEQWKPNDDLNIGGQNVIQSLQRFLRGMEDPELLALVPEILREERRVAGVILVPALQEFVKESRRELNAKVYRGTHRKIVQFLHDVIGPQLDEAYQELLKQQRRQSRKRFLRELAAGLPVIGEVEEGGETLPQEEEEKRTAKPKPITVNESDLEIALGQSFDFVVTDKDPSIADDDLIWDAKGSGGDITEEQGLFTRYTAERLGNHTLVVYNRRQLSQRVEIPITVLAHAPYGITPRNPRREAGESVSFTFYGGNVKDGFHWSVKDSDRGRATGIHVAKQGKPTGTLDVLNTCREGTYLVTCVNGKLEATVKLRVGPPKEQPFVVFEGRKFYLWSNLVPSDPLVTCRKRLLRGKEVHVFEINESHPDMQVLKDEFSDSNALLHERMVISYVLEYAVQNEIVPVDEAFTKVDALGNQVIRARKDKRKK